MGNFERSRVRRLASELSGPAVIAVGVIGTAALVGCGQAEAHPRAVCNIQLARGDAPRTYDLAARTLAVDGAVPDGVTYDFGDGTTAQGEPNEPVRHHFPAGAHAVSATVKAHIENASGGAALPPAMCDALIPSTAP